jgi:hypothetical protein
MSEGEKVKESPSSTEQREANVSVFDEKLGTWESDAGAEE